MSDVVEYILKLKDELSGGLNNAKKSADSLNEKMSSTKELVKGIGEAFGIYFAATKITEFAKESIDAFNEQEQAIAQVKIGLESMGGASGRTLDQLKEFAELKMGQSLYDDDEILGKVTATMITFGNITGDVFDQSQQAVLDLSTRMKGDLQGAAVQVGKALNDPIQGIKALSRVGVSFSKDQQNVIKTLQETGHVAEAQALILKELQREFGGSAKAAYDALSPMEKMQKNIKKMHENVGELLVRIQTKFIPIIESMIKGIESAVHWISEHKEGLEQLAVVVGIAAGAFLLFQGYLLALEVPLALTTAAMWLLDAAMDANPVGLIIAGIAALSAGFYVLYQRSETFRAVFAGIGAVVSGIIPLFTALGEIIAGIFNPSLMVKGARDMSAALSSISANGGISGMFSAGYDASITESHKVLAKSAAAAKSAAKGGAAGAGAGVGGSMSSAGSVSGSKNTTINITIGSLTKDIVFHTTNLRDSAMHVKEAITKSMLEAINDSQIAAAE